jgi:uncharacterized protein (TIGR02265 family)
MHGQVTQGSVFEALFTRVLKPEGVFLEDLRRAGFDPRELRPEYSTSVWRACLEIASRHEYPSEPLEEGCRLLGKRFVGGFLETLIGKFARAILNLVSGRKYVERIPTFLRMGTNLKVETTWIGETRALITLSPMEPSEASFLAGTVDAGLQMTKTKGAAPAQVRAEAPGRCVLDISWTP